MPRAPLAIGTYGRIATQQVGNSWRASARYRDTDGVTRTIQAFGASGPKAERALKAALQQRATTATVGDLTPRTRVHALVDAWLIEAAESDRREQTLVQYRAAAKIITTPHTGIGRLTIAEATTGRVDAFLKSVAADRPAMARMCRVVLKGSFSLAVRHGAATLNAVRETAPIKASRKTVRALTADELTRLRARVAEWQTGAQMPEEKRRRQNGGQARTTRLLDLINVCLGTGARIGEILALRWEDINLSTTPTEVTISGTITNTPGTGLIRQGHGKTAKSHRTVLLPQFATDTLLRLQETAEGGSEYVFPNSTSGLWSEANLNTVWRKARGPEFEWVTWHTFRKTVATVVNDEASIDDAAAQLGHSDRRVTQAHYVQNADKAPDLTAILEQLGE